MSAPAMPADRPLAEVVAEGRRLQIKPGQKVFNERQTFFLYDHGPTLLAVAEAGDRLYDYAQHAPICAGTHDRPCDCGLAEALGAWDSAAGAREGEGEGR